MTDIFRDSINEAVLVFGRRVSQDTLESAELTQRGVRSLAEYVGSLGPDLRYVHMGTTVNWVEGAADEIPSEGADAIIGRVVARAEDHDGEGSGGPVKLDRSQFENLSPNAPDFWSKIEARLGVSIEGPDTLVLAPAGWSVAELHDGAAVYDEDDECFGEDHEPLAITCSEDFPPGVEVSVSELPETFWLRATYA